MRAPLLIFAGFIGCAGAALGPACGSEIIETGPAAGAAGSMSSSATATGGAAGTGAIATTTGTGGSAPCNPGCSQQGLQCCAGRCVNLGNDIVNCGVCGKTCGGEHPYCQAGTCTQSPCFAAPPPTCPAGGFCCGKQCCDAGQLCCYGPEGPGVLYCAKPNEQGTCVPGCPACVCAAPTTPIATPSGERPIADLRRGDTVYSVDGGQVRAVRVALTKRLPVSHHRAVRLQFEDGRTVLISAGHPLADGRMVGEVRAGDLLHGVSVRSVELVPYDFDATYDILPESDTGTYFAADALVGSTLFGRIVVPPQSFLLPVVALSPNAAVGDPSARLEQIPR